MGSLGDMDGIKMNGDANGGTVLDNEQMERLKNEILNEMKKHMNKVKDEIITGESGRPWISLHTPHYITSMSAVEVSRS